MQRRIRRCRKPAVVGKPTRSLAQPRTYGPSPYSQSASSSRLKGVVVLMGRLKRSTEAEQWRGGEMLSFDHPASNQLHPLGTPFSHDDVADMVEEPSAHDVRATAVDERKAAIYRAAAEELGKRRKEPSRV